MASTAALNFHIVKNHLSWNIQDTSSFDAKPLAWPKSNLQLGHCHPQHQVSYPLHLHQSHVNVSGGEFPLLPQSVEFLLCFVKVTHNRPTTSQMQLTAPVRVKCSHLIPPSRLSVVQLLCDNCSVIPCGAWLGSVWQHLPALITC